MLSDIFTWLQGKKTYIVMIMGVLVNGAFAMDLIDDKTVLFVDGLLTFFGMGSIRAGISKGAKAGLLLSVLLIGACSPVLLPEIRELQANDLGYVACIEGSGPPMTGQGHVLLIGLKKGFEGIIMVKAGCEVAVDHYLPYREKVEELRRSKLPGT